MNHNRTNPIICILSSIGIGAIATTICTAVFEGFTLTVFRYAVWLMASVLFGAVSKLAFCREGANWFTATLLHCPVCFLIALAALKLGKYNITGADVLSVLLTIAAVYICIYCGCYFYARAEAKKINHALHSKQDRTRRT